MALIARTKVRAYLRNKNKNNVNSNSNSNSNDNDNDNSNSEKQIPYGVITRKTGATASLSQFLERF